MRRVCRERAASPPRTREPAVSRQRGGRTLSRPRAGRRLRARRGYGRRSAGRPRGRRPADRAAGRGGRAAARRQKLCPRRGTTGHRLRTGTSRARRRRPHRARGRRRRTCSSSRGRRGHRRARGRRALGHRRTRTRGPTARRRRTAQLSDPVNRGRIETGEVTGLDVKTPDLNLLQQLCALQSQLLGQLVNSRRQRQLLPDLNPVPRAGRDPGGILDGSGKSLASRSRPRRRLL